MDILFPKGIQLTECTEVTKHSLNLPGFSDGNKGLTDGIVFMHPGVQLRLKKKKKVPESVLILTCRALLS